MERTNVPNIQREPDPNYLAQPSRHPNIPYPTQWPQSSSQRHLSLSRSPSSAGGASRKLSTGAPYTVRPRPSQAFQDNVIDPNLEDISFPEFAVPVHSNPVTHPLHRFYLESEEPWNGIRPFGPSSLGVPPRGASYPIPPELSNYRSGPNSEIESHETAPYASDSGYMTIDAQSVFSLPQADSSQECSDLPLRVEAMQPFHDAVSTGSNDTKDLVGKYGRRGELKFAPTPNPRNKNMLEKCKRCGATPKCPSDFKKHMLKHDKPFKCSVPGCKKKGGFTTINDLKRHEKSVHKIGTAEKSYRCAAANCKNRHKIWPRLDNFKQHVTRMHPEEDLDDFIKRSQWDGKQSRTPTPRPSTLVAPMETTLAGIDDHSKHAPMSIFGTNNFNLAYEGVKHWESTVTPNPQTLEFEDGQHEPSASSDVGYYTHQQHHHVHSGAAGGAAPAVPLPRSRPEPYLRPEPTVSIASPSGLTALADAACGSGVKNQLPDDDASSRPGAQGVQHKHQHYRNSSGNPSSSNRSHDDSSSSSHRSQQQSSQHAISTHADASTSGSRPRKESDEERHKRALGQLSTVIADGISRYTGQSKGESLPETIFRVLTSATELPLPSHRSVPGFPSANLLDAEQATTAAAQAGEASKAGGTNGNFQVNPLDIEQGLSSLAAMLKKQRPRKGSALGSRQTTGLQVYRKECSVCHHPFNRNCDLKKHMKRHDRPYGCTYPKCNKSFGSKSDWKRHENSQHFQIETWRCQIEMNSKSSSSRPHGHPQQQPSHRAHLHCGSLFFRSEQFKEHLQKQHNLSSSSTSSSSNPHSTSHADLEKEIKTRRIGRNGQGRFWCGFCGDIIELKEKRTQAWDERFNHIDEHFKQGLSVKQWWCMEAKKTKGEVEKLMNRQNFDDESDGDGDGGGEDDAVDAEEMSSPDGEGMGGEVEDPAARSAKAEQRVRATSSRKRQRAKEEDASDGRPKKKYQTLLNCCFCGAGPYDRKMYSACMECEHQVCPKCTMTAVEHGNE